MTYLMLAMLEAPLVAWPKKGQMLHAATMESIAAAWPDGPVEAACGAEGLYLLEYEDYLVPWPPRVVGLAPYIRCKPCHDATGRKRPRSDFKWARDDVPAAV